MRKTIIPLLKNLFQCTTGAQFISAPASILSIITLAQAAIYLAIRRFLPLNLEHYMCIISGLMLIYAHKYPQTRTLSTLSFKDIPIILFFQTLGLVSGFSRLGSVLIASRLLCFNIQDSWSIAILLGIPLSLGSGMYESSQVICNIYMFLLVTLTYCCYLFSTKINLHFMVCIKFCNSIIVWWVK